MVDANVNNIQTLMCVRFACIHQQNVRAVYRYNFCVVDLMLCFSQQLDHILFNATETWQSEQDHHIYRDVQFLPIHSVCVVLRRQLVYYHISFVSLRGIYAANEQTNSSFVTTCFVYCAWPGGKMYKEPTSIPNSHPSECKTQDPSPNPFFFQRHDDDRLVTNWCRRTETHARIEFEMNISSRFAVQTGQATIVEKGKFKKIHLSIV